ncbi:MAG TPA: ABC transporter ATP-binding protein, partial [Burkholderiaceae bacterium]|nr:ABC transporter ATP-binding protein [Burkholderiaceae bacterium]
MTPASREGTTLSDLGRVATEGLDLTHGVVLYLEGISVSFDGFRALNNLSLSID